jgi:hypothetical protein
VILEVVEISQHMLSHSQVILSGSYGDTCQRGGSILHIKPTKSDNPVERPNVAMVE